MTYRPIAENYQREFHLLVEEGVHYRFFATEDADRAENWRREMRTRARGQFKIRTGVLDRQDRLLVWAELPDVGAGEYAPISLDEELGR